MKRLNQTESPIFVALCVSVFKRKIVFGFYLHVCLDIFICLFIFYFILFYLLFYFSFFYFYLFIYLLIAVWLFFGKKLSFLSFCI